MSINDASRFDWDRVTNKTGLEPWATMAEEEAAHTSWDLEAEQEDMVGAPKHYNSGNIECIDAIEESMSSHAFKGYLKGNCMKYLWRYDYKGKQVEDLQKAGWYLRRLTDMVTEENS